MAKVSVSANFATSAEQVWALIRSGAAFPSRALIGIPRPPWASRRTHPELSCRNLSRVLACALPFPSDLHGLTRYQNAHPADPLPHDHYRFLSISTKAGCGLQSDLSGLVLVWVSRPRTFPLQPGSL